MSLDLSLENRCEMCTSREEHFDRNITHNLIPMWKKAGVYDALYNSDGKNPEEFIEVLGRGMHDMRTNPEEYKKLNPENGWGDYEGAIDFLEEFNRACLDSPLQSIIRVCK